MLSESPVCLKLKLLHQSAAEWNLPTAWSLNRPPHARTSWTVFAVVFFKQLVVFLFFFLRLWHGVGTAVTHHSVHCGATGFHSSHSGKFHCTTAQLHRPASLKRPEAPQLSTYRPALFCKRYRFRFVDAPNRKSNTHTVRSNDIV